MLKSTWPPLTGKTQAHHLVAGIVAGYTVLALILPPVIRHVAAQQLTGSSREVRSGSEAESVRALGHRGRPPHQGQGRRTLRFVDEVYVNFQLSSLFGRAWAFKEISTTRRSSARDEPGWHV